MTLVVVHAGHQPGLLTAAMQATLVAAAAISTVVTAPVTVRCAERSPRW
jgi:hypothetical protein